MSEWQDAREVARLTYLSWGWTPMDAAWAAYYGKPFSAVVVVTKMSEAESRPKITNSPPRTNGDLDDGDYGPKYHWQDFYDPVGRIPLPFGLFPQWRRWQSFRCWRDVVAIPAARRWLARRHP